MIVSNLQNSARIEALHPLFKQLFDYVKITTCCILHVEESNWTAATCSSTM